MVSVGRPQRGAAVVPAVAVSFFIGVVFNCRNCSTSYALSFRRARLRLVIDTDRDDAAEKLVDDAADGIGAVDGWLTFLGSQPPDVG